MMMGFYVDVNAVDDDDRVGTTPESAVPGGDHHAPAIGEHVLAVDADDNVCDAVVVDAADSWLLLQLDQSTWWRP